ncbi:MAG: tetratricopeptide repeat protein, partial [Chloroflexota bacterium]
TGKAKQGIEHCSKALDLIRRVVDRSGEGDALVNLAIAYSKGGQQDAAQETLQLAYEVYAEIGAMHLVEKVDQLRQGFTSQS